MDEQGISRVKTDLNSLYLDDLIYDPDVYKDKLHSREGMGGEYKKVKMRRCV